MRVMRKFIFSAPERLLRTLVVATTILVTGCDILPPASKVDTQAQWQAQLLWLQDLRNWRVSGRLAVQIPDDGWSASLRWRQRAANYRIDLSGPFGQGAMRINGSPTRVALRTADGQVRRASSAEQLVAAELGVEVPISLLPHWLLGRPAPEVPVDKMHWRPDGSLEFLSQAGWQVQYLEYESVEERTLPSRISIEQGETQAKFALTSWRLERSTPKAR